MVHWVAIIFRLSWGIGTPNLRFFGIYYYCILKALLLGGDATDAKAYKPHKQTPLLQGKLGEQFAGLNRVLALGGKQESRRAGR